MSTMINRGKELIRINPTNNAKIDYSRNNGITWAVRYSGSSSVGTFIDLMDNGQELVATTSKGVYYSKNEGITLVFRSR